MANPIRVILIDDHPRVYRIVSLILGKNRDIELVGQGANGKEAIHLCEDLQPDLVLMDVVMPGMDGVQATSILNNRFPKIKILVLSSYQDHESILSMLRNGAAGYILKESLSENLVTTIRTVFQGDYVLSPEITAQLVQPEARPASPAGQRFRLTEREIEILALMAQGEDMASMANQLAISPSTVKYHIVNICRKLGVETRAEALVIAAKNNLV
jgi:two-component system, NarL family, response regulator LiaR